MLKSLTKENFWNDLYRKYPGEMEVFCQWIDSYKESIGWKHLLGSAIKYHDLPIALQIGIFIQFTFETPHYNIFFNGQYIPTMEEFVEQIKDFFHEEVQSQANLEKHIADQYDDGADQEEEKMMDMGLGLTQKDVDGDGPFMGTSF